MTTKKNKGILKRNITANTSILWYLGLLVAAFLFVAPYYQGLFNSEHVQFDRPIYFTFLWSSIMLLVISMLIYKWWQEMSRQEIYLILFIWLIPVSHLLSLFQAASHHMALKSVYIHIAYAICFITGLLLTRQKAGKWFLPYALLLSGYAVVIFGYFNWLGFDDYPDAIFGSTRLSSVFQYPNTYAAYLIALLFGAIIMIIYNGKWYTVGLHSVMLVPVINSFLLTNSNGALLTLPVVLFILLCFLKWHQQLQILLYSGISFVSAWIIAGKMKKIRNEINAQEIINSAEGFIWLITASVVTALIIFVLHISYERWLKARLNELFSRKIYHALIPGLLVLAGIIGLYIVFGNSPVTERFPEPLQTVVERVNLEDSSAFQRALYYQDSFEIVKDYPVFGAGGGAWAQLYEKYRSYPYISNQAHNFYMQYVLEVGLLGLLILLGFVALTLYIFICNFDPQIYLDRLIYLTFAVTILIHSFLDFDMSYVYIGALVFLSLGGMILDKQNDNKAVKKWAILAKFKWGYVSATVIMAVIVFFTSAQAIQADSRYKQVVTQTVINSDVYQLLNQAIEANPYHSEYMLTKIGLLTNAFVNDKDERLYSEAIKLIENLKQREPYNLILYNYEYQIYLANNELEKALTTAKQHLEVDPWNAEVYEKVITLDFELGNRARKKNQQNLTDQYWNDAIRVHSQMEQLIDKVSQIPREKIGNETFSTTNQIILTMGKIYFIKGDVQKAEVVLKTGLSNKLDNEINREITRWYLASMGKQQKADQARYDALIKADPQEQLNIERLMQGQF